MNFSNDVQNNKLSSVEPQCMKDRPSINLSTSPLTEEQVKVAKTELVNKSFVSLTFPKVVKLRQDPPLAQQNYTLFTFVPSTQATPDKDGCFGVMKIRGTFPTPQEAEEWGENLIRNCDSYHENLIGYVGKDFPLTMDSKYCLSTKEVDIRTKMDNVARDNIRSHRQMEKKEMEEIQERQRQLLTDTSESKEDTVDDLDYYVQLKTKVASVRMLQEECDKKMKDCGKIIKKAKAELNNLDDKFPEYQKEYADKYKLALEAIGGDTQNNKMLEYMK